MYEPMYQGYSSRSTSRLPPIHAIGKAKPVDEDEPPDIPLHAFGFDADGDYNLSPAENVFEASDAEDVCKLLRKAFHMLGPGRHACKRNPDHGGSHFVHCRRGVKLGGYYSHLRRLLEERARLECLRDCVYRLRSAQLYVEELEGVLNAEYRTAYAIRHGCLVEVPVSKLYCLNALCEDLRVHVSHWNSIKQRVNTGCRTRPLLGFLCHDLGAVNKALGLLCDRAIFLLDRLVHVGFEVLAHCSLEALTPDILWNITRGLEDFNTITATFRMHASIEGVYVPPQNSSRFQMYSCLYLHPALANMPGRLSDGIKTVPFSKVLGVLANERSRYAALLTHRFFTANEAFQTAVHLASNTYQLTMEWEEDLVSSISGDFLHSRSFCGDGLDYQYHRTVDNESHASLNAALLQIGPLRVPDLSSLPSPLMEFSQKEQQFADSFLQIVCTSTSLLRKNDSANNNNSRAKSKHRTDFKIPLSSPVVGRPPKVQGETPVLSRSDSRRKTVSWGDNADSSIRSQVGAMYLDALWQHFGRNLDLFLDEPAWAGKVGMLRSNIGSILLQGDAVSALLRHMIEHICMKDMFPSGSVTPLLGVVIRLHALSSFAAWDAYVSSATSVQPVDRCYPCQLADGQYSTHSGQLLRDAHRPLLSLLQDVCHNMGQKHSESADLMPPYDLDLSLVSGISSRLVFTCQLALSWCTGKLHQFLTTWNVKSYLFVACTDLKILTEYSQRACYLLQMLTSNPLGPSSSLLDQLAVAQLSEAYRHANYISSQMQTLDRLAVKKFTENFAQLANEFFQDHLPTAKAWRRKVPAEFPDDPSSYVQLMWDNLISPVLEGIVKLPVSSQVSVLTAVVITLCGSWTSVFLKEKTKFSLFGAHQLGVDFDSIRTRLSNELTSPQVRSDILELTVFRQLNGVVQLLKRQPHRRATSRFRDCSTEDLSCESGDTASSPCASQTELPTSMEEAQESNDICYVPNMDEWLALRVIGGSRTWRFPSCFGATPSQT